MGGLTFGISIAGEQPIERPTSNVQRPIRGDQFSNVRAIFAAFIGQSVLKFVAFCAQILPAVLNFGFKTMDL